jgi:hypothetical protein
MTAKTCIPLTYFAKFPMLTTWEATTYWIVHASGLTREEAAKLSGKSVGNINKTYAKTRKKLMEHESEK